MPRTTDCAPPCPRTRCDETSTTRTPTLPVVRHGRRRLAPQRLPCPMHLGRRPGGRRRYAILLSPECGRRADAGETPQATTRDSYDPTTGCARPLLVRADGARADLGLRFDRVCQAYRQPRSCSATKGAMRSELTAPLKVCRNRTNGSAVEMPGVSVKAIVRVQPAGCAT